MSSGYCYCSCPDCFEIAIGDTEDEGGTLCNDCEEAGCDGGECLVPGAYGGDGEGGYSVTWLLADDTDPSVLDALPSEVDSIEIGAELCKDFGVDAKFYDATRWLRGEAHSDGSWTYR